MDISTSTVGREADCNTHSAHGSVPEIEKTKTSVLDGADFVTDVIDTYLEVGVRCT
jgi:hypothetical protein